MLSAWLQAPVPARLLRRMVGVADLLHKTHTPTAFACPRIELYVHVICVQWPARAVRREHYTPLTAFPQVVSQP